MKRPANYLSPYNMRYILDLQAARERREREANPPKYGPGIKEAEEGYRRSRAMCVCASHCADRCEPSHCGPFDRCRCWCHAEAQRVAPALRPTTEAGPVYRREGNWS